MIRLSLAIGVVAAGLVGTALAQTPQPPVSACDGAENPPACNAIRGDRAEGWPAQSRAEITVPGYGFILHNRGALFSLDAASPNVIAPHKRPFNTLSAGFVMDGARPLMSLLLMGGDMQAQGHAQALVDILDLGANLQMATDMARFHHSQVSNRLTLEAELNAAVGDQLAAMGHRLTPPGSGGVGGFQAIYIDRPAAQDALPIYRAASDHRKDGQAVGW